MESHPSSRLGMSSSCQCKAGFLGAGTELSRMEGLLKDPSCAFSIGESLRGWPPEVGGNRFPARTPG